ncbi:MAG: tRNA pseudouridine(55) synthase TruB [Gammaproteobacteria bacterium]|nr:tRNA pseudouridine(55) synthase TruB [Gammaproteobacteria bacterium]
MNGGFLLIKKDREISSNSLDNRVKRALSFSKVGHLGTLDPLAEGLLILMVDRATKLAKYFDDLNKVYELEIRLGARTRSLDLEGEITDFKEVNFEGQDELIDETLKSFIGKSSQIPPLASAIKVNGKKLYELERQNIDYTPKGRDVELIDVKRISDIKTINNNTYFTCLCHTSKGYYVRSLARDFGDKLHVPSLASGINRVKVGKFSIDNAYTLSDIENGNYKLINPLDYLDFKRVNLDDTNDLKNGVWIKNVYGNYEYIIFCDKKGTPIAISKLDASKNVYRIDTMLEL